MNAQRIERFAVSACCLILAFSIALIFLGNYMDRRRRDAAKRKQDVVAAHLIALRSLSGHKQTHNEVESALQHFTAIPITSSEYAEAEDLIWPYLTDSEHLQAAIRLLKEPTLSSASSARRHLLAVSHENLAAQEESQALLSRSEELLSLADAALDDNSFHPPPASDRARDLCEEFVPVERIKQLRNGNWLATAGPKGGFETSVCLTDPTGTRIITQFRSDR